jgi:HPt (histidine-containing phosphotransfer) domain-containing protein
MHAIDPTTFDNLKETLGADFIVELIDAFLEDAPVQVRQLKEALAAQDADAFRRAAHTLKSNARTFGAGGLADLSQELETMGRENNLETGNRLEVMEEALAEVVRQLKALR